MPRRPPHDFPLTGGVSKRTARRIASRTYRFLPDSACFRAFDTFAFASRTEDHPVIPTGAERKRGVVEGPVLPMRRQNRSLDCAAPSTSLGAGRRLRWG